MIKNYTEFLHKVYEGLIMTYDIDSTLSDLKYYLYFLIGDNYKLYKRTNNTIEIEINYKIDQDLFDILITRINTFGYYPSKLELGTESNRKIYTYEYDNIINIINDNDICYISIIVESKFDEKIINIPNKLYHVCRKVNLKKITEIGLISKSGSKKGNHPERIYFTINYESSLEIKKELIKSDFLRSIKNPITMKPYEYITLEIETPKNIILYRDPNYWKNGCYTYDNIHPDKILSK